MTRVNGSRNNMIIENSKLESQGVPQCDSRERLGLYQTRECLEDCTFKTLLTNFFPLLGLLMPGRAQKLSSKFSQG